MNRVPPSVQKTIELRALARERKERVNRRASEIVERRENARGEQSINGTPKPQDYMTKEEEVSRFRRMSRVIVQIDLDGKPVREWENTSRAENELGIQGIKAVLFGLKDQIGGYVWKWKLDI